VYCILYVQPSDSSSWVTSNAAAPVPRFASVTLPPAPRAPFSEPRQSSAAPPAHQLQPQAPSALSAVASPPPPPSGQPPSTLTRFGVPPSAASTGGGTTETITVTNVVSAPAINKLGSLFNSLNKTVAGALNTFIAQQQQQPQPASPGQWQPVGQQFGQQPQQLHQQYPQQHLPQHMAPNAVPVQRFPAAAAPLPQAGSVNDVPPQPLPLLQAPQRPPGAPRLPSDASSAFVRVGQTGVDWQTRADAPLPMPPQQQYRPQPNHHHHAVPSPQPLPPIHVQQAPSVAAPPHMTQPQQFTNAAGEMYHELPRSRVDPRMHLAPAVRGNFNSVDVNPSSTLSSLS